MVAVGYYYEGDCPGTIHPYYLYVAGGLILAMSFVLLLFAVIIKITKTFYITGFFLALGYLIMMLGIAIWGSVAVFGM